MTLVPVGAVAMLAAGRAEAATPTYYNSLAAFQADITFTVTDDYQNAGYVNNQSNAVMNAVLGETDYMTTGFMNWNLVVGVGHYCAGCNGSFELAFQTTTVGNALGVNGVGVDIAAHDVGSQYYAYITFADGTTANVALPAAGTFWGVAAPERIERIHFGLSNGVSTTGGYFEIDNLIIGDGNIGACEDAGDCVDDMNPCTDAVCVGNFCQYVPNTAPCDDGNQCTDDICSEGTCTGQFNANPCDDEELCTENDVCAVGICQGTLVVCNDDNECTTDFCEFGVGCNAVNNTAPCDDANVCTEGDACAAGTCAGAQANCGDDDICTADSCDPERGCVSDPIPGCCDEDSDCGADEVCDRETNSCAGSSAEGTAGSTGGEGTGGDVGSGNPADTGVDESGGAESGVVTTSGADTGSADTGTAGSSDGTGGLDAEPPDFSVCSCTSTPPPQQRLWWLMLPLGLWLRRRRRAA